jgi:hypothetical protein
MVTPKPQVAAMPTLRQKIADIGRTCHDERKTAAEDPFARSAEGTCERRVRE